MELVKIMSIIDGSYLQYHVTDLVTKDEQELIQLVKENKTTILFVVEKMFDAKYHATIMSVISVISVVSKGSAELFMHKSKGFNGKTVYVYFTKPKLSEEVEQGLIDAFKAARKKSYDDTHITAKKTKRKKRPRKTH